MRTLLRNRIHAVLADYGHNRPSGYFTRPGRHWLDGLNLPDASRMVVADLLDLIDVLAPPIAVLDQQLAAQACGDPRVKILTQLPGGTLTALVILAETGDITCLPSARKLAT
jgi:transposase